MLVNDCKKFFIDLYIDPYSLINKIKINDNFYNVRVKINENFYEVFYKGNYSEVKVLRDTEYESLKNLPKNYTKEESNFLISPMPGKVVNVLVKIGDVVNAGDTIIVLDAMKMENILKSDYKAKVLEIFIEKDQAVSADQNLIKLQQLN